MPPPVPPPLPGLPKMPPLPPMPKMPGIPPGAPRMPPLPPMPSRGAPPSSSHQQHQHQHQHQQHMHHMQHMQHQQQQHQHQHQQQHHQQQQHQQHMHHHQQQQHQQHMHQQPPQQVNHQHQHQHHQQLLHAAQMQYMQQHQQHQQNQQQGHPMFDGGSAGGNRGHGGGRTQRMELKEPTNTVWLGGHTNTLTDDHLRQVFSRFGRIVRIARPPRGGIIFVHFVHVDEARRAAEEMVNTGAMGQNIAVNYGKMFTYTEDELRGGGGGGGGGGAPGIQGRPPRGDDAAPQQPTNVMFIGDLPSSVPEQQVRDILAPFGEVVEYHRPEGKDLVFVNFSSVDECARAVNALRGQPLAGFPVRVNYGRGDARFPPNARPSHHHHHHHHHHHQHYQQHHGGGGGWSEASATNVIWMGGFSKAARQEDFHELLDRYEGFINVKVMFDKLMAFAHFDTVEHAVQARKNLEMQHLLGEPFRLNFGRDNHSLTMEDRYDNPDRPNRSAVSRGAPGGSIDHFHGHGSVSGGPVAHDASAPPPLAAYPGSSGQLALVHGGGSRPPGGQRGDLVLPPSSTATLATVAQPPSLYQRERVAPTATLETKVASLMSASYYNCGDNTSHMTEAVTTAACDKIDQCTSEQLSNELYDALNPQMSICGAHVMAVMAKRIHEYHGEDPAKKLHLLHAATRLLGSTFLQDGPTKSIMEAYVALVFVVSGNMDSDAAAHVQTIIDGVKKTYLSGREDKLYDPMFIKAIEDGFGVIAEKMQAEDELEELMAKRRRKEKEQA